MDQVHQKRRPEGQTLDFDGGSRECFALDCSPRWTPQSGHGSPLAFLRRGVLGVERVCLCGLPLWHRRLAAADPDFLGLLPGGVAYVLVLCDVAPATGRHFTSL